MFKKVTSKHNIFHQTRLNLTFLCIVFSLAKKLSQVNIFERGWRKTCFDSIIFSFFCEIKQLYISDVRKKSQ